jgi:hypothetical protein
VPKWFGFFVPVIGLVTTPELSTFFENKKERIVYAGMLCLDSPLQRPLLHFFLFSEQGNHIVLQKKKKTTTINGNGLKRKCS